MKVRGLKFWERLNMYHALLSLSNFKFVLLIFTTFTLINLIFAGIYLYIGISFFTDTRVLDCLAFV